MADRWGTAEMERLLEDRPPRRRSGYLTGAAVAALVMVGVVTLNPVGLYREWTAPEPPPSTLPPPDCTARDLAIEAAPTKPAYVTGERVVVRGQIRSTSPGPCRLRGRPLRLVQEAGGSIVPECTSTMLVSDAGGRGVWATDAPPLGRPCSGGEHTLDPGTSFLFEASWDQETCDPSLRMSCEGPPAPPGRYTAVYFVPGAASPPVAFEIASP
jgi:hypothetical protein